MKTKRKRAPAKPELLNSTVIGVRFNEKQLQRFNATTEELAIPLQVPVATVIKTFALMALEGFERDRAGERGNK
jgi:hypothetical protein